MFVNVLSMGIEFWGYVLRRVRLRYVCWGMFFKWFDLFDMCSGIVVKRIDFEIRMFGFTL